MAFGFFRRRQKLVMIIMVLLMISFLVGYQGFELFARRSDDPVIGRMGDEKIKLSQKQTADSDVTVLKRLAALPWGGYFMVLQNANQGEDDLATSFALLQAEAHRAGIRVSPAEVESEIDALARSYGGDVPTLLRNLREQKIGKIELASALEHWLMIVRYFEASQLTVPPSQPELEHFYRDTQEKIKLDVVTLKASDFLAKVGQPTDEEVRTLFLNFAKWSPGEQINEGNPFGFGYKQPDRANVQYLLVRSDVIGRISKPTDGEIQAEYLKDKAKYGDKQLSDVYEEISNELLDSVKAKKTSEVINPLQTAIDALVKQGLPPGTNIYEKVKDDMGATAENVLARTIEDPSGRGLHIDKPVVQAVADLARMADLDAICYPTDMEGGIKIAPDLRVSLNESKPITLGQALDKITEQCLGPQAHPSTAASKPAPVPRIIWKTCKGLDRVIFAAGPENLDLFPLKAGQTGMKDAAEFSKDPIGSAGQPGQEGDLVRQVFTARVFNRPGVSPSAIVVGARAAAAGELRDMEGTLLWRLAEAKASYEPALADLNSDPQIRAQVVKDWRESRGYVLALDQAKAIVAAAKTKGLEKALKEDAALKELKVTPEITDTGFFARKEVISARVMFEQRINEAVTEWELGAIGKEGKLPSKEDVDQYRSFLHQRFAPQEAAIEPMQIAPSQEISGIDLGQGLPRQQFIDAAFALRRPTSSRPTRTSPPRRCRSQAAARSGSDAADRFCPCRDLAIPGYGNSAGSGDEFPAVRPHRRRTDVADRARLVHPETAADAAGPAARSVHHHQDPVSGPAWAMKFGLA